MRINRYIALATGLSRRAADAVITEGRVLINDTPAAQGRDIAGTDVVKLDNKPLQPAPAIQTIMLNKPAGYVVSRDGQGSRTIYDLLPPELHHLKPVGRLDKDSSGLLLLTNDGQLAQQLTHPKYIKQKVYEIELDKPLSPADEQKIEQGIPIGDYLSQLQLSKIENGQRKTENRTWRVTMSQGRNRQIRRTLAAVGYTVTNLHRTQFGDYQLRNLKSGQYSAASKIA